MSDDQLHRLQSDLSIIQRALGLCLPFGKGVLVLNLLLVLVASCAIFFSLMIESDWLQQVPFALILLLFPIGLFLRARKTNHEVNMQVAMSIVAYAVVWIAASSYLIAISVGPALGFARTALLFSTGVCILAAFTLLLVRAALKSRDQYYCLGLALSNMLAGMLLPILGKDYGYPIAHSCMAIGFLTGFMIQWSQLREAKTDYAAD